MTAPKILGLDAVGAILAMDVFNQERDVLVCKKSLNVAKSLELP